MKRLWILITLLALVLALPLSVSADIIYEPDDDFFEQHSWECKHVDRSYVTNGPNGELIIYASPENCLIEMVVPNQEVIHISYVYTDPEGIEWGYLWRTGWTPMLYVVPVYNSYEFCEEFADRLQEEPGKVSVLPEQEVYFWEYPGSDGYFTDEISHPEDAPEYDRTFVDDAGWKWGEIGYYYGMRGYWICLDDPSADYTTLYANHPPQQVSKPDVQPKPEPETTAPTEVEVTEPPTPETQPDTQPTTQPDTQPTTQPDTQPTTQPDTQPTTQPDTQPTTQPVSSDKIITPSGISPTTIVIAAVAVAAVSVGLLVVLKKKKQ